uniref:EOG090X07B6 n=1 Tax=Daphnia lumholtzi TaxID=42856 RepID=A0A4Y7MEV3_9CRUS|nr:EOG090X07B6 [Daphnia lumholtzi]
MADGADTRVNLAALKRVDPYAVEIVETGTQVAIYKFNSQSNEWEKTDVEGTLFLYARSGDPRHGFVVMNRLSTENLVEPITRDLEIQLQAPFLLYKNAKLSITGVWFYEESECTRIAQKLEALVKEETERRRTNLVQEKSNVDIMSLLTKAGQEYEQVVKHYIYGKPVSTSSSVDVVPRTSSQKNTSGTPPRHTGLQSVALMSPMMFTSASGTNIETHLQEQTLKSPRRVYGGGDGGVDRRALLRSLISYNNRNTKNILISDSRILEELSEQPDTLPLSQYRERERLRRRRSRLRDRFFSRLRDLFRRSFDFDRERVRLRERERDLFLRSRDLERERRRREREDDRFTEGQVVKEFLHLLLHREDFTIQLIHVVTKACTHVTKVCKLMSAMDAGTKKNGIFAAGECNDNKPYPIFKIDCCFDIDGKISSLEAKKKMMKAVGADMRKMADEAKQLRWENAKLMLENLWKYNMLQSEESACAAVITQNHH